MQGLIVENISNIYKVKTEKGIIEAVARGKLKNEGITPIVGDIVIFSETMISGIEEKIINNIEENDKKTVVIEEIKERKVEIKRPKLSNITQLIFVISSKDPKPDLYMLDKQLAFAEYLNIKPIIVLNKTDLDRKEELKKVKQIYEKIGYIVIETQAKNGKGIQELKKYLKNNISAFSGNSGVGKSTLINQIFEKDLTQEGEISKKNKRGKNTTTSVKLYEIEQNTYIADTPRIFNI